MTESPALRQGWLQVPDGNELFHEMWGNPKGAPVLFLHGGPGSGFGSYHRDWIDPERQFIVAFDQRGCGRSRPRVNERLDLLDSNTTAAQLNDIERLRQHLGVTGWAVVGISWGATLALQYAQRFADRVTGMALMAVTNTSTREVEWITEQMGRVFPEQWEQFASAVDRRPGERVVDAYARAMRSADARGRAAAAKAWCEWEDTHVSLAPGWRPDPRYQDAQLREVLATLVTHYWAHSGFGGDDIIANAALLPSVGATLIHGRHDVSSPLDTAWRLHRVWPGSQLVVTGEGHGGDDSFAQLRAAVRAFGAD